MSVGFVYILTNPYMQDVYKVGCTERAPHARAEELSKATGVPAPFQVLCYIEVDDFQQVEKRLHKWLTPFRISDNREFFHLGLIHAVRWLWWLPERLSFCEPGLPGNAGMLVDGPLWDGEITHLMQTENPWGKPKPVEPSPEEVANSAIEAARTTSIDANLGGEAA